MLSCHFAQKFHRLVDEVWHGCGKILRLSVAFFDVPCYVSRYFHISEQCFPCNQPPRFTHVHACHYIYSIPVMLITITFQLLLLLTANFHLTSLRHHLAGASCQYILQPVLTKTHHYILPPHATTAVPTYYCILPLLRNNTTQTGSCACLYLDTYRYRYIDI